jgi:hypothetical protein
LPLCEKVFILTRRHGEHSGITRRAARNVFANTLSSTPPSVPFFGVDTIAYFVTASKRNTRFRGVTHSVAVRQGLLFNALKIKDLIIGKPYAYSLLGT